MRLMFGVQVGWEEPKHEQQMARLWNSLSQQERQDLVVLEEIWTMCQTVRSFEIFSTVATISGRVVSALKYHCEPSGIVIRQVYTAPAARRYGAGTALLEAAKARVNEYSTLGLVAVVPETNLAAQKWFRNRRFRAKEWPDTTGRKEYCRRIFPDESYLFFHYHKSGDRKK